MSLLTFKGGVHPFDGKDLTKDKPIKEYSSQGDLVFPLSQHIGAPATPVVKKGDQVLAGQLIGKENGFISANVHSSVSGTVKAIEPRLTVAGVRVNSIVIENDGEFNTVDFLKNVKPLEQMSKQEIREAVKAAGIVGMGGAGFPTHVKLSPKNEDEIDHIIINCAECEPYLTSDYRRMLEEPEKLVGGLRAILAIFPKATGVLAVEDNKPEAIKCLENLAKGESRIKVETLATKYPQGAERQLIYAVTKRQINSSMLPADAYCIVQNADTVVAVYHAIYEGRPLMHRIITVTGEAIKEPCNFRVCIGTNYRELIEAAGGFTTEPEKIISGGPMMGISLTTVDVPVAKTSSALLCMPKDAVALSEPSGCIKCGRCVEACPSHILPTLLESHASHNNMEAFLHYHGLECCECGTCSYVCPAKRHLTQSIKTMRRKALAQKKN